MHSIIRTYSKRIIAGGLLLTALLAGTLSAQQTGTVSGQVRNEATSAFLDGARVEVVGTNQVALTDRSGYFSFVLPAGPATLAVSYTGLEPQTISVVVPAGGVTTQSVALTSDVYVLEKFTVAGPREGSAAAITAQKFAPNVKNVVSSDSFGNIADGNVGDFLQQMPGITAVYVGADVRSVMIRGIDGALNSVTMDGDRVASSQSAGLGRTFEFEQASLNLIETIEVTKAPTPDMDADSIGGNVNMKAKSAFDRAIRRYVNYTVGGVYRPKYYTRSNTWVKEPIDHVGPSLNFTYADRLGTEERIGIMVTGTYHSQPGGDTAALMAYQNQMVDPYYISSVSVPRPAGAPRTRLSTGLKLDYKLSETTILTFNTNYNHFHENNDTRTMNLITGAAVGNFRPGFSKLFTEALPVNASRSNMTVVTDDKSGRTYLFSPTFRHRRPGLEVDGGMSYSNSHTYYEYSPHNRHYKSRPKGSVTMRVENVGWAVDRTQGSLKWPRIWQTAGPDIYDLNNYHNMVLTQTDRGGKDIMKSLRLNARKAFETAAPAYIKVGGNIREQRRRLWSSAQQYDYLGPAGSYGQFLYTDGKWTDSNEGYRPPPWPSAYAIARHAADHPELWRANETYAWTQKNAADRDIVETVTAAYVMGGVSLGDLSIMGGLRVEETKTDAKGPVQVGGVYTGERIAIGGKYRDVFPGVHFRYSPNNNLVSRLSYSNGIGRPGFGDIIPLTNINEQSQFISDSNPALQPQYADNFDFTVEYYFEPVGSLTASLFLKEVSNFHFLTTSILQPGNPYGEEYNGWEHRIRRNGGQARYRGYELAYQQQLRFLPGFWRGFGLYANYTYMQTEGDYGTTIATSQVAGFIPKMANAAITFNDANWSIRLNAVWRSDYLTAVNANPALLSYQENKLQVNLKTRYSFSRRLALFCDIENLNKSPITETYQGNKDRPTQTRIVVAKIVAGITGTF